MINKKEPFFLVLIFLAMVFAVVFRQHSVTRETNRDIVSAISEWAEKGKPVVVTKLKAADVKMYKKITVTLSGLSFCHAYVPGIVKDQLRIGQTVFSSINPPVILGQVSRVFNDIDLDTGMYYIEIMVTNPEVLGNNPIVLVNVDTFRKVICVPNEILSFDDDSYSLWTVENNKAVKKQVVIDRRDGYGSIIKTGLKEGDLIVIEGLSNLKPGDLVNILNKSVIEEKDND